MDHETIKKEALKKASLAFNTACTIREEERIEVYYDKGTIKTTDALGPKEEIIYSVPDKVLLYQVYGNSYLEDEIRSWIDQARGEEEPQGLAEQVCELTESIAKGSGRSLEEVSSNEVFANLSLSMLEQIESSILDYWWENDEEEDGKRLAESQIDEGLEQIV